MPSSTPSVLFGKIYFSSIALSQNGETYSVVATDANGNTDSDSFTLSVVANPDDATKTCNTPTYGLPSWITAT